MKVLKYDIITELIIEIYKKDVVIVFSMTKNTKKITRQDFLKAYSHLLKLLGK